jgi:hypothetical protein
MEPLGSEVPRANFESSDQVRQDCDNAAALARWSSESAYVPYTCREVAGTADLAFSARLSINNFRVFRERFLFKVHPWRFAKLTAEHLDIFWLPLGTSGRPALWRATCRIAAAGIVFLWKQDVLSAIWMVDPSRLVSCPTTLRKGITMYLSGGIGLDASSGVPGLPTWRVGL